MKNYLKIALGLLLALALSGCSPEELSPLCIVHTNDVHGHISPERVEGWSKKLGGAAVLAGCVSDLRERNSRQGVPMLLLDAGDIFLGTPEGSVSQGKAVVEVMNAVGYDAMDIGNHEFDMGVDVIESLAREARFPILGANVVNSTTGLTPDFLHRYLVKECGDLRVGIVGLITQETPEIVMPGRTERILFRDSEKVLRSCMAELAQEGVDFIIVVSHCGLEADKKLASSVRGIGVIVGGHEHELLKRPVRIGSTGTLILQAGSSGQYLGVLSAQVDPRTGSVRKYSYEVLPLEEGRCKADPAVADIVKKWAAKTGEQFDRKVGTSLSDFPLVVDGESALGDMIADSMRAASGADIAFHNSYGIRNSLLKGAVTVRDVYKIMPFDNTLYTMTLTGKQIRKILEQSLAGEILNISGLRIEYRRSAPEGRRIISIMQDGKNIDDAKSYRVVTNSFLAKGGDNFTTFCEGREVVNSGVIDLNAMSDYMRSHSPLSAEAFRLDRLIPR
ncbi:MAG: bifunctional UDP-sugar hydrolase/5'-nucleotidase [Candidatus Aureabacteria bacterium]|nr:bifunctional UDP-sugar hydrolase/5'-nucleotidase [Candidatus Auribacterota bacterium]